MGEQIANNRKDVLCAAVEASEAIMRIYQNESIPVKWKPDGSPVTIADSTSASIILGHLQKSGIPIIDEENLVAPYSERQHWGDVWLVDPLDGTREFIKRSGEFVVNIALVHLGQPIFGLIASPVRRTILLGELKKGAFLLNFSDIYRPTKWKRLMTSNSIAHRPLVFTRSHAPYNEQELMLIRTLEKQKTIRYIKLGSALKFFDLAQGTADVYPRFAPSMEWDIAAGHAILEALGGQIIEAKTQQVLRYNKRSLINPNFIAKTRHFIQFFDN